MDALIGFWLSPNPLQYSIEHGLKDIWVYRTPVYLVPYLLQHSFALEIATAIKIAHVFSYILAYFAVVCATRNVIRKVCPSSQQMQQVSLCVLLAVAFVNAWGVSAVTQFGGGWNLALVANFVASVFSSKHSILKSVLTLALGAFNKENVFIFTPLLLIDLRSRSNKQNVALLAGVVGSVCLYLGVRKLFPAIDGKTNFSLQNLAMSFGVLLNFGRMMTHKSSQWVILVVPIVALYLSNLKRLRTESHLLFWCSIAAVAVNLRFGNTDEFRVFLDALFVAFLFVLTVFTQEMAQNRAIAGIITRRFWLMLPVAYTLVFVLASGIGFAGTLQHGLYAHIEKQQSNELAGHFALYNELEAEKTSESALFINLKMRLEGLAAESGSKKLVLVILEQDGQKLIERMYVAKEATTLQISLKNLRLGRFKIKFWTGHFYVPFIDFEAPDRELRSANYELSGEGVIFHRVDPRNISVLPWYGIRIFGT